MQGVIADPNAMQQQTVATSQAGDVTNISPTVDPFLGQGGNGTDSHARQNSADSGLGTFVPGRYYSLGYNYKNTKFRMSSPFKHQWQLIPGIIYMYHKAHCILKTGGHKQQLFTK